MCCFHFLWWTVQINLLESCLILEVLCSSWKTTFHRQNLIFCWLEKFILSNCHTEKEFLHPLLGYTIQINPVKLKKLKEDIKDCSVNRVRAVPSITSVCIIQSSVSFSRSCAVLLKGIWGSLFGFAAIINPFWWGSPPAFLWLYKEWDNAGFWV